MLCQQCHSPNHDQSVHCVTCGAYLGAKATLAPERIESETHMVCPQCKTVNSNNLAHCLKCGKYLIKNDSQGPEMRIPPIDTPQMNARLDSARGKEFTKPIHDERREQNLLASLLMESSSHSVQTPLAPKTAGITEQPDIVCPLCTNSQSIQKVSAIYSSGVSYSTIEYPVAIHHDGKTFYGSDTRKATHMTSLARDLAPPLLPKRKNVSVLWLIIPFVPYLNFLMLFAPLANKKTMGRIFLLMICLSPMSFVLLINEPYRTPAIIVFITVSIILVIAFYVSYVKGLVATQRLHAQTFEEQYAHYTNALNIWNKLYYCRIHDRVFDPSTSKCVTPQQMNELFHS